MGCGEITGRLLAPERRSALCAQAIATLMGSFMRDPAQLKQVLDGIALAEGKSPADADTGG
jgi:hypothetical protein